MVVQVNWTREALADVDAIAEYIAKDSPAYASAMARRFFDATDKLGDFPGMGRELPELDRSDYRDWIVGVYRVVYRVDLEAGQLYVIAVVHGMRQLMGVIGDRLPKRRKKP